MKLLIRVLLGAVLGVLAWAVAFFVAEMLIVWSGWPRSLRRDHSGVIVTLSVLVAVVPCVFALGAVFKRMFGSQRVGYAIAAMGLALMFESALVMFPPGSWWLVVLPFLSGRRLWRVCWIER